MRYLRNPVYRRSMLAFLAAALVFSGGAYSLFPASRLRAAIYVFCVCAVLLGIHVFVNVRRYGAIARLSQEIDRILHGADGLRFSDSTEGELAVLCSEIRKMTVRLREQADRLADDKKFLADAMADVSHQLRTPLTSLNLVLTLLEEPELPLSRRDELLQEMGRLLGRLDWLISSLLLLSRIDASAVVFASERVPVSDLIAQVRTPLEIPLELRGITLQTEIQPGAAFSGDLRWTAEAVSNIVKNAAEHTPAGGTIRIEASENAVCTEICISDSGAGIAPEDLPHLFERFYRGQSASGESVGIGLALAQSIISAQNGTLKAANLPEGGAKFTLRLYKSVV